MHPVEQQLDGKATCAHSFRRGCALTGQANRRLRGGIPQRERDSDTMQPISAIVSVFDGGNDSPIEQDSTGRGGLRQAGPGRRHQHEKADGSR
jgi:hypothetical protein